METKSVLAIAAVAMLALVIGQVQAESIEINGDFKMYKPGTNYTVRARSDDGEFWIQGIGDDLAVLNDVIVDYDDGTTGTVVDCPGWVTPITLPAWRDGEDFTTAIVQLFEPSEVPDGTSALNCFGAWSGQNGNLAESSKPLGIIGEGASYTLSAMFDGNTFPLTFELRAGGVAMPPSSSVTPDTNPAGWVEVSRTYNAEDITAFIGEPFVIRVGTTPPHTMAEDDPDRLVGARGKFDNITLDGENLWNPSPGDGEVIILNENLELSWNNRPPVDANDVYVDVWFGTEPNELSPNYDMTLIVDAGEDTDAVIVDASVEDAYYWQVNTYVYGADKIDDANMIEGKLWVFYAVDDLAPAVQIVTLDQMTWAGEGVALDSTVSDDAVSTVSVEWSADLPDGISAAFDPGNEADTTVTLTKVLYGEALIANAGFEDSVLGDDNYNSEHPGWGWFANGGGLGTWNIGSEYGGVAPEGENIGWSEPTGGFAQVLAETLSADTTYTLSVEVGNPPGYAWGGYKVQLLAGGTPGDTGGITVGVVLAEDDNSLTVAESTFVTSVVTFDSTGVGPALLGEPLQIRLLVPAEGEEVDFDDVRLTADPGFIPTGVQTVTVTVAATDEGNPTPGVDGTASIEIDVYDDACHLARVGLGRSAATDFNVNCITDLEELVVMVEAWLDNYASTGPVVRP